jgi:hypothetical protein
MLVRRLTAAVLTTAAAAAAIAGIAVSAAGDAAVRAEVALAGKDQHLELRRIRILEGLTPGESYRLPAFGVRNHRGVRTSYRLVVSAGSGAERRPPPGWLRFVPAAFVIDGGRSRAVAVRLRLPTGAEPGVYAVVLGVRPGGSDGAVLTFRIEPTSRTSGRLQRGANLAMWAISALLGAALVALLVRG